MKRLVSVAFFASAVCFGAHADRSDATVSDAGDVLQAAWTAALILPDEKRQRLASAFLEIALLSGDPGLVASWEARFGQPAAAPPSYPDYGWQMAAPVLESGGVDTLIDLARNKAEPLTYGRADALLAAGKRLAAEDPDGSRRLNLALLDLVKTASSFERAVLGHAAAELAMTRCDAGLFDRATGHTSAPNSLRYAFWRARITGNTSGLLDRVRALESEDDTRDVRQVLEGYRAIQELGYCPQQKSKIG